MGSFGERLRREREMRGIGLDEIAEATKIGSRSLRALEDEDFQKLPGGIFNKGFVRAYARYLGIDEEQAVADYLAAETSFQQAPSATDPIPMEARPRISLFAPVTIGLAVLVLILGGWRYFRAPSGIAKNSIAPTPVSTLPVPPPATPSSNAAPAVQSGEKAARVEAAPSSAASAPAATANQSSRAGPPASTQVASTSQEFVVQVRARAESWISAATDGAAASEYTLPAAGEKSFRARERLVLKVGNLPGVEISYNGKPLEIAATNSNVRTLTFTAQGLRPE